MRFVLVLFLLLVIHPSLAKEKKPVITGQRTLRTAQSDPITISLRDLDVKKGDGSTYPDYPAGFTLRIFNGDNYTISGTTVRPTSGFTGTLTVPVRVNDGKNNSEKFDLKIEVFAEQTNTPPSIIGQLAIISNGGPVTVRLSDLIVSDPDDSYPSGFTLILGNGSNYSLNGNSVIPSPGFSGIITVPVRVNDGEAQSAPFDLKITVQGTAQNKAPVITGQTSMSTLRDQPVTIRLSNLLVSDPDNQYPNDFSLSVQGGSNYTVNGNTITPNPGYTGNLNVNLTVNDGKNTSNVFSFRIQVIESAELVITGQSLLEVEEGQSIDIKLSDLTVNDPDKKYPSGFTLAIQKGDNYTVNGSTVIPASDFSGNLEVPITVTGGGRTSRPYPLMISVLPANDPPVLDGVDESPVVYSEGDGPVSIARNVSVSDPDNETLFFAEIGFRDDGFQFGADVLIPTRNSTSIRSVFDQQNGILFLIGEAPLDEYASMIQSVTYQFQSSDTLEPAGKKELYFLLNDGKTGSELRYRSIVFGASILLDIPNVFTPNNDDSNDRWVISPASGTESSGEISIRVYSKIGSLVYESSSLGEEWDGNTSGKAVPVDTYFYVIDIAMPFSKREFKGTVTVLR